MSELRRFVVRRTDNVCLRVGDDGVLHPLEGEEPNDRLVPEADVDRLVEGLKAESKRFPILGTGGAVTISWELAEEAYLVYSKRFGHEQSLKRLAERGGFAPEELDQFRPGWRPIEQALAAKDAQASELRQAIGLLTTLVPDMQMDVEHPLEMAGRIVAQFQTKDAQIADLHNTLTQRDAFVKEQRSRIDQLEQQLAALSAEITLWRDNTEKSLLGVKALLREVEAKTQALQEAAIFVAHVEIKDKHAERSALHAKLFHILNDAAKGGVE